MTAYINGFIEWRTTWFILDPRGINSSYEPPQITGFVFFLRVLQITIIKYTLSMLVLLKLHKSIFQSQINEIFKSQIKVLHFLDYSIITKENFNSKTVRGL